MSRPHKVYRRNWPARRAVLQSCKACYAAKAFGNATCSHTTLPTFTQVILATCSACAARGPSENNNASCLIPNRFSKHADNCRQQIFKTPQIPTQQMQTKDVKPAWIRQPVRKQRGIALPTPRLAQSDFECSWPHQVTSTGIAQMAVGNVAIARKI